MDFLLRLGGILTNCNDGMEDFNKKYGKSLGVIGG